MADIIALKRSHIRSEKKPPAGGICDVIIFPGVRYERWEDRSSGPAVCLGENRALELTAPIATGSPS
jgi:hypothetical protein